MTSTWLLAAVLGIGAGTLAGIFGVGGGMVFVPALSLGLGLGQLDAAATSLAAMVGVAMVGAARQHRAGLVAWRAAGTIGLVSLPGVLAGAAVAESIPEDLLRRLFGALLLLVALQLTLEARRRRR